VAQAKIDSFPAFLRVPQREAGIMAPKRGKTIEEIYQKLSQLDHILLRPDTYVGSIEMQNDHMWVYDAKQQQMVRQSLSFVPGLYKIFDEVLVNAADNFVRDPEHQTYIKVTIDEKAGCVSVENNGQGLPVAMHKEHNMYVPDMVFGHLLTSDNYDDAEKKVVGGRNGYGAKLANIFSTRFEVECVDSDSCQKYHQTWTENMRHKGEAKITASKGDSYTKVSFWPDLQRFGMKKLDKDIVALMTRRCYDVAGATPKKCRIHLNGKPLDVKDFKEYVELYTGDQEVVYEKAGDRWEIAMAVSDGQFQQVSFVNSIATVKGGTHVTHVAEQFVEAILKRVSSKNKGGMEIKPYHVKNYLWLFVNSQIENPTFDSQTKETMTLKAPKFGSKCDVPEGMINKVLKTGIVDSILSWAKAKEEIDMGKQFKSGAQAGRGKGKRLHIPKLEDANLAGGREGRDCTLILTEGDSAKSLAVAGLSVIGRDRYGVFPLRGKLLNVREASYDQIKNNAEISNISKILGIEPRKDHRSTQSMRYGHVMIMADQDFDGSHIKGLIINVVQHWWPSLYQLPGFLNEFVTPIVKASRRGVVHQFFTMPEYEQWKEKNGNGRGWSIKYYKGLGTSTTQEAKEYFRNIEGHSLSFDFNDENDNEVIDLAFNRKRADDRKDWINSAEDGAFVDHSKASLSYTDFVHKELVLFAKYDVMRNIPCIVDGLKPVQRKIMFAAFKRNLKGDTKVAQFAGYVSEHSSYHHGETSLQGAIIGLAQNFVGSNNVNLLTPSGQFGTRLQGGKDAASPRYIYTRLEKITRLIFHPDDDKLLDYQNEEGQWIEPEWYIPVLPMLLFNGAEGIGTGWATFVPNYDPRDVIENMKRYMRCEPMKDICPWYRGFKGSIMPSAEKDAYDVGGVINKRGPTTLEVTELPVKKWTQDYKEFLQSMISTDGPGSGQIEDFKEYHTEQTVHFVITVTEAQMAALERGGLEKVFKLRSSVSVNNLILFDKDGKIRKYANELEILEDFAQLRLEYYHKRKEYLLGRLRQQLEILSEKVRFIELVIAEKLKVKNRKKDVLIEDLLKNKFRPLYEITNGDDVDVQPSNEGGGDSEQGTQTKKKTSPAWEYLLGMPLWSLTNERIADLKRQREQKREEMERLQNTAPEELWLVDLDAVLDELDALDMRAGMTAEEEKKLCRAQKRNAGSLSFALKRRRTSGSISAAPSSAPPPPVVAPLAADSATMRAMQERQLSHSIVNFPGLFDDLVPVLSQRAQASGDAETSKEVQSAEAGQQMKQRRLGSFFQRSAAGKARAKARLSKSGSTGGQDEEHDGAADKETETAEKKKRSADEAEVKPAARRQKR